MALETNKIKRSPQNGETKQNFSYPKPISKYAEPMPIITQRGGLMELWVDNLLIEYKKGRKQLRKMVNTLDDKNAMDKEDKKTLNSAIRDMDFVIEWLETGVFPENNLLYRTWKNQKVFAYDGEFVYGGTGNRGHLIGGFPNAYKDPYQEVDDKIDQELEESRNDAHCKYDTKTK